MISVIVPVYKVEDYLDRCIQSIVSQSYTDLEIILVDDGSPDRCPAMCDAWAERDKRIKVIHKKNGGLSDARNAGLGIATGQYISFVDSDDWVANDFLEVLYTVASNTHSDICECGIIKTDRVISFEREGDEEPICYGTAEALELLIQDTVFHQYVWNKLYRCTCIKGISFVTGKINEDEFWTYQVFGRANRIAKIEKKLYYYLQRKGSIMNETYSLKRLDALEAKIGRQAYIDKNFPQLSGISRENLLGTCLYSGQMALRYMTGQERNEAIKISEKYFRAAGKGIGKLPSTKKQKLWYYLAFIRFVSTCRLRNQLNIGL